MKTVRLWSIRNAGWLKKCYALLEGTLALFNPLLKAIGHERLDKPFAAVEGAVKGFLFDSQSCGQCTLGETGMACPMNCPKTLRNGPCGGVRQNGGCEIKPEMTCFWAAPRIPLRLLWIFARIAWPRRSPLVHSSSRPSTASTWSA